MIRSSESICKNQGENWSHWGGECGWTGNEGAWGRRHKHREELRSQRDVRTVIANVLILPSGQLLESTVLRILGKGLI